MTNFARWSGATQDVLRKFHPIKLGQAQQVLAAGLGHPSYSSFRDLDLAVLNAGARYAFFDGAAAFVRARSLGLVYTEAQFQELLSALSRADISGEMSVVMPEAMVWAARKAFDESRDLRFDEIRKSVGAGDRHVAYDSFCPLEVEDLPDVLPYEVIGDVLALSGMQTMSIPVLAKIEFRKIGRRLYAAGDLLSLEQTGQPFPYQPDLNDDNVSEVEPHSIQDTEFSQVTEAFAGQPCPKTGTWVPSNNPKFYPEDYAERVMKRQFQAGVILPPTPHGEPSWILQENSGPPLKNFSGMTPEQILEAIKKP